MKKIVVSFLLFFFASMSVVLAADSLADVAKKEKERRAKIHKPAKVITNQDVEDFKEKVEASGELPAGTIQTTGGSSVSTDEQEAAKPEKSTEKTEEDWRKDYSTAKQQLEDAQKDLDAAQSYSNGSAYNMGVDQLTGAAANRAGSLDEAKQKLQDAQDKLENVQENARKSGVPPGWVDNQ